MAEGLRLVGACPRCGGELVWAQERAAPAVAATSTAARDDAVAPHLVLGVPRR